MLAAFKFEVPQDKIECRAFLHIVKMSNIAEMIEVNRTLMESIKENEKYVKLGRALCVVIDLTEEESIELVKETAAKLRPDVPKTPEEAAKVINTAALAKGFSYEMSPSILVRARGESFMVSSDDYIITGEYLLFKGTGLSIEFDPSGGRVKFVYGDDNNYLFTTALANRVHSEDWHFASDVTTIKGIDYYTRADSELYVLRTWAAGEVYTSGSRVYIGNAALDLSTSVHAYLFDVKKKLAVAYYTLNDVLIVEIKINRVHLKHNGSTFEVIPREEAYEVFSE